MRVTDQLVTEIEAESRQRNCARSDVVRERLQRGAGSVSNSSLGLTLIADLIGSVDGLPAGMSQNNKSYLKATSYGKKRSR